LKKAYWDFGTVYWKRSAGQTPELWASEV